MNKIRTYFPNDYWIVEIPKNSLTQFLIYLPQDFKEFIKALAEGDPSCDFGIWEIKKLRKKIWK